MTEPDHSRVTDPAAAPDDPPSVQTDPGPLDELAGPPGAAADDEWEDEDPSAAEGVSAEGRPARRRRRRRPAAAEAAEVRMQGRRALCKTIPEIAPHMLKTVKLRILGNFLDSTRGLEDEDLTEAMKAGAPKLVDRGRVLAAVSAPDPQYDRGQLRALLLAVLIEEETYSLDETRLDEKVIEFEKGLLRRSKSLDLTELRKDDPDRWHQFDTYRIVLEAAWADDDMISADEARLLGVLRAHLKISQEEHWLISALIKRFPKEKGALHTPDEVNEARKELQRAGLFWSYRDETNRNVDVIPAEIATIVRTEVTGRELQATNCRRLLSHDGITLADLRGVLAAHGLDKAGPKADLVARLAASDVRPSEVLGALDKDKLAAMCASVGLRMSGSKPELIDRLIAFYDDLTFEERVAKDERAEWYADYELLAGRRYAELRAKKVIDKDLDIQGMFEQATAYLFEARLRARCDRSYKDNRADGRVHLEDGQCILWDCKSAEVAVNLQDHLEGQFDGYLRKEKESGRQPLSFLVIGPSFTPQSLLLANQYKARTNWDVALVTAEGLKHLAERWAAAEPDKPFPVRLLNRTDLIDKDRAEFLLSLA
jgi:SAP domain